MSETYFFDTYAIFEIIHGNPKYEKYSSMKGITTIFNLAELNHGLKKENDKTTADAITDNYAPLLVEVSIDNIKDAADLKIRKKELTIPDALGYVIARKHNLRFLTGDKEFEKMPFVEFVKK